MLAEGNLIVLEQYQRLLLGELEELQHKISCNDRAEEAFDGIRETISMIFSKLAEHQLHTKGSSTSLKSTRRYESRQTSEQQNMQLYNDLVARNHDIEKADRRFLRRLEKLEILLYQKDYEEALAKIDGYKKNNITFETEEESELKSADDSINQAFYQSEMREQDCQAKQLNAFTAAMKVVQDDTISIEVKENMVFGVVDLLNGDQQMSDEELKHVTLEEVLQARRTYDKQTTSPFSMDSLQLPSTERFRGNEELFASENKHPFQNRMILRSMKYLDQESPIRSRESLKQLERKLHLPDTHQKFQQTGKKKPMVDLSSLNNLSQVYVSETGKKLMITGKRQRSMTSRKRQPTDEKKSKTLTKETEKKKLTRRTNCATIASVAQPQIHLKTFRC